MLVSIGQRRDGVDEETYPLQSVVEVADVDEVAVQQALVLVPQLLGALLGDEQPGAQLVGLDLEEAGELVEVHGGVEAEVRLDGGAPHVGLDLVHEDGEVVLDGVDVGLGVVKVRGHGGDELGAGGAEQLLEDGEALGPAALQLEQLVAVLFAQRRVDGVVEAGGLEGDADGNEGVHLLVLLGDGVVLRVLLEVLGARHVHQDVAEHADGVGVPVHHHVAEADVVVRGEVGGHDARKHGLLVELNVVERLERQAEVAQQAVHAQQANDGKVPQHLIQVLGSVLAGHRGRVLVALHRRQLLRDLRPLDQRVQHVEHAVRAPRVGVLAQDLDLLLVGRLARDPRSVRAEGVELVDEFVNHVPRPVVLRELASD